MLHDTINLTVFAAGEEENKYLAIIQSADAKLKDKLDACRELGRVGSQKAVAPLAALLTDEKLSHMARYGLEPNPDPSVNAALRDALGKVNGRLKAGVIGSLGVRQDGEAVPALISCLKDSDPVVARAAARALGSIGAREATMALFEALENGPKEIKLCVCEGIFRSAEGMEKRGRKEIAVRLYERLSKVDEPKQVKAGAELALKRLQ